MTFSTHPFLSLFRIRLSIHRLSKLSERRFGLSIVQWCFLRRLIQMPAVSAQTLAQTVGVHPSTLTQTLKRLHRRGLIFITEDPRDSRKKTISVTRQGKEALDLAEVRMNQFLESFDGADRSGFALNQVNGYLAKLLGSKNAESSPTSVKRI